MLAVDLARRRSLRLLGRRRHLLLVTGGAFSSPFSFVISHLTATTSASATTAASKHTREEQGTTAGRESTTQTLAATQAKNNLRDRT
jgi:hypothetical protein